MAFVDDSSKEKLNRLSSKALKVQFLRARAISRLVSETIDIFNQYEDEILSGTLDRPLIELIPCADTMEKIYQRSLKDVYNFPRAVEIEVAGYELTQGLLDVFVSCVNEVATAKREGRKPAHRNFKIIQLIPQEYCNPELPEWQNNDYVRLMSVLDFICSMTDTRAVSLFKKIKGISLPGQ